MTIMITFYVRISHPRPEVGFGLWAYHQSNPDSPHGATHTITHTRTSRRPAETIYQVTFQVGCLWKHADWALKIKITSFQLLLSDAISISQIKVAWCKWPQNQQQCLRHSYILLRWTWLGNDSWRERNQEMGFVLFCSVYASLRLLLEEVLSLLQFTSPN